MQRWSVERHFIENTFRPVPKLTGPYRRWEYWRVARRIRSASLAYLFSTDIGIGMTRGFAGRVAHPSRVYVGFTQDGPWPADRIEAVGAALRQFDAITMFTEEERGVYVPRYGLRPERVRVIPIHTDETGGYGHYPDDPPLPEPYILSLGSPNRRFTPLAEICHERRIPLVIITRPSHKNDALDELRRLGANVITDADRMKALTHLKHARAAVMIFDKPTLPGGFTTLVHAMFLRTPFIVSNCLGMREHVIDGETGFVTPHDDTAALAEAVGTLMDDPALAEQFSAKAYRRAQERHSLEAAAQAFAELTESFVRSK
jgi:glycosyltransferase involved in cell wall biosynthesis